MTHKRGLMILIVAIILTAALLLGCGGEGGWDGMDRNGPAWTATTPTVSTEYVPDVQVPGGWK